jgi:hypothetical protein
MYVLKIQKNGYGLDSYVHRETGSKRGGGGSAMDYYLELCFSRPQLEVESE